jgi:hypothetical protein
MKFSLNFCAIEIIVLCFMIPAILVSSDENLRFDFKLFEWKKTIGEFYFVWKFKSRLTSSISEFWIPTLFLFPIGFWSDQEGYRKVLMFIPIVTGILTVLGENNPGTVNANLRFPCIQWEWIKKKIRSHCIQGKRKLAFTVPGIIHKSLNNLQIETIQICGKTCSDK